MRPEDAFNSQKEFEDTLEVDDISEKEFILSFETNSSSLGINFERVHEVVDYFPPTSYPFNIDGHIGVINLRGNVVPIIDPFKQDMDKIEPDFCKYIILETLNNNLVGIVVSNARKVEIDIEKISDVIEDEIISLEGKPLRYVKIEGILKNYKENLDEIE